VVRLSAAWTCRLGWVAVERQGLTRASGTAGFRRRRWPALPATIRYTARGAVSLERLDADANGDLLSTVTSPWAEGTTGITRSPLELLEQLAALVPLPRLPTLGDSGQSRKKPAGWAVRSGAGLGYGNPLMG
jgi:hypothetical protein